MNKTGAMAAICAALAIAGVAADARAQSKSPSTQTFPAFSDQSSSTGLNRKSLQWTGKGRWGLKLEFQQPSTGPVQWHEVDAGVHLRLSPQWSVSGMAGMAGQTANPQLAAPTQPPAPRVRLETSFRF